MDLQFLRALDIREGVKWVKGELIEFKFVVVSSMFLLFANADKQLINKFTRHLRSWGVHIARTIEDYDKAWRTDDEADFVAYSFDPVTSNLVRGLITNAQGLRYALHYLRHTLNNVTDEHFLALEKYITEHNIYVRDEKITGGARFYQLGETLGGGCGGRTHTKALDELSKVIGSFVLECMCVKKCLLEAPHMTSNHLFVLNKRFKEDFSPYMTELLNEIFDDAYVIDEFISFAQNMEELILFIDQYRSLEDVVKGVLRQREIDFIQLRYDIQTIIE